MANRDNAKIAIIGKVPGFFIFILRKLICCLAGWWLAAW
jgi:hypothetical protein